jgi:hypothetical protein
VSAQARDWLDKQRGLSHVEHRVLSVLASLAGKSDAACYQSYPQLAERCECNEASVCRVVASLCAEPALVKVHRDGRYGVTNYQLQLSTVRMSKGLHKVNPESAHEVIPEPAAEVAADQPSEVTSCAPSNDPGIAPCNGRDCTMQSQGAHEVNPAPYNKPELTVRTGSKGADAPPEPSPEAENEPAAQLTAGQHANAIFAALYDAIPDGSKPTQSTRGLMMRKLTELCAAKDPATVAAAFTVENMAGALRRKVYPFDKGFAAVWSHAEVAFDRLAETADVAPIADPSEPVRGWRMRTPLQRLADTQAAAAACQGG